MFPQELRESSPEGVSERCAISSQFEGHAGTREKNVFSQLPLIFQEVPSTFSLSSGVAGLKYSCDSGGGGTEQPKTSATPDKLFITNLPARQQD